MQLVVLVNLTHVEIKNPTARQAKPSGEKTLKDHKLLYMTQGFISRRTKGFNVTEGGTAVHGRVVLIRQLCCNRPGINPIQLDDIFGKK